MRCKARQELCGTDRPLAHDAVPHLNDRLLQRDALPRVFASKPFRIRTSKKCVCKAFGICTCKMSPEMNSCRKCGGFPLLCILPFTIFVCESVFISVHLWLHLLAFFACLLYFLCFLYRPWRPIPLVQLSALGGGGGGVGGRRCKLGQIASGMGAFKRTFIGAL